MPAFDNIVIALSIIPSTENEARLLSALREAEATTRRFEGHSYQLQTTNSRNERRIHQLETELVALKQTYAKREEMYAQRECEWAQEDIRRKEEEDKRRALIEEERKEQERKGNILTSEKLGDLAHKRKRYLEDEEEKQEKMQVLQTEKAPETKQQVRKAEHNNEIKDGTTKESKDAESQVVVKKEPADEPPKNEKKVMLSCNTLYEMTRKREIHLREEEARKKRNQEEAHDLWEKAVLAWEKEKEQTRKDIQAARAYNKQAKNDHQMLSISARMNLIDGEVPPLILRPVPTMPTKPALYDFLAAAAAKKD